jgi:hypothetical protein
VHKSNHQPNTGLGRKKNQSEAHATGQHDELKKTRWKMEGSLGSRVLKEIEEESLDKVRESGDGPIP